MLSRACQIDGGAATKHYRTVLVVVHEALVRNIARQKEAFDRLKEEHLMQKLNFEKVGVAVLRKGSEGEGVTILAGRSWPAWSKRNPLGDLLSYF